MKAGAIILTLLGGIGAFFYRDRKRGGIQASSKFRGQVKRAMDEIESVAPYKFRNDNVHLSTPRATEVHRGLPVYWHKEERRWVGGHWFGAGRIAVALHNGNIRDDVLIHELWHVLLGQHGIALDKHHAIMRGYKVFGA